MLNAHCRVCSTLLSGVTVSRVFQKMIIAECVLHYQLSVCSAAVKSKTGKMIIAEFVPLYQLPVCSAAVKKKIFAK